MSKFLFFLRHNSPLPQLNRIFDAVKGEQIETTVYLGGYLGLRRGEILGLTWDNIDFENKVIHIRQTRTRIVRELYQNRNEQTRPAS